MHWAKDQGPINHVFPYRYVRYWTQTAPTKNFGDYLTDLLLEGVLGVPVFPSGAYRLIGSAIQGEIIASDLSQLQRDDDTISYWCCGARSDRPIDAALLTRCHFFGVRGPLTRDLLQLPETTPLGDPGFLVPAIYLPKPSARSHAKSVCVPHFNEPRSHSELKSQTGADVVLSPAVSSIAELQELIDAIASADFVIAGAMHAAIVACAYRRPFAFLDSGFIDTEFKWRDLAALIHVEPVFVRDVASGMTQWAAWSKNLVGPQLMPMLQCCPWSIRPSVIEMALKVDHGAPLSLKDFERTRPSDVWEEKLVQAARNRFAAGLPTLNSHTLVFPAGHPAMRSTLAALELAVLKVKAALKSEAFRFYSVEDQRPVELLFGIGEAGPEFLSDGWSVPNEIGPWAVAPIAEVVLPEATCWSAAKSLDISGYVFAPQVAPYFGKRRIKVWIRESLVYNEIVTNRFSDNSCVTTLRCEIPMSVAAQGGRLSIKFEFDQLHSLQELQLGSDARKIAFAIARIVPTSFQETEGS